MIRRFCVLLVPLLAAAAQEPLARQKEAALGAELAKEVRKDHTVLESPALKGYLERLGGALAPQLPGGPAYSFEIIATDRGACANEPVWLPGGYIFVPRGLFPAAANEAEMAGMIAHAMAHAPALHGRKTTGSGNAAVYIAVDPECRAMAVPRAWAESQRAGEVEADRLAVEAMSRAGYDPAALAAYLERAGTAVPEARLAALRETIAALPARAYAPRDGFDAMREEARRLAPAPPVREPPSLRRPPR